jgi:hypothetical protein
VATRVELCGSPAISSDPRAVRAALQLLPDNAGALLCVEQGWDVVQLCDELSR